MECTFAETISPVMIALCKNAYQRLGFVPQTPLVCTVVWEMVGITQYVCVRGSLKDKKTLCIISWGGGREIQRTGVLRWGRGQRPSSESLRWPNSQHIGILCHHHPPPPPPLFFFIIFTIILPLLNCSTCLFPPWQSFNWAGTTLAPVRPFTIAAHSSLPATCGTLSR